jgi:predicted transcriptional regulator of viral defense system
MPVDRQELRRRLFQLAAKQVGYFTAAQARSIGYSYQAQKHHVNRHNWARVDRGLFRIPEWPHSPSDELVRWSLWSRERGVVSHERALATHEIGELEPRRMHLTVPPTFKSRDPGVMLHFGDLPEGDIEEHDGFRITTPVRSIIDVATGGVDLDQLARVIDDALKRGLFTIRTLRDRGEAIDPSAALRVERALRELEHR